MVFKNVSYFSSDPYNMNLYDIEYIPYRVPKSLQNYGSIISHSIMYMYIKDTYRIDNKTKKKKIMKWFVYLNTFHKFSISLKKTLRSSSSFSHINLHLFVSFLVEGSRILSIKSVIDTQATSIIRGNRINRQTDPVTVLSAWHMSTCKYGRTVHGFDTRIWPGWNVYLRESHRSQGVSGYNVVSRVIIQSKRDPVSRIGNASHYPLLCMYKSTCEDFNRRKPSRETPHCAG